MTRTRFWHLAGAMLAIAMTISLLTTIWGVRADAAAAAGNSTTVQTVTATTTCTTTVTTPVTTTLTTPVTTTVTAPAQTVTNTQTVTATLTIPSTTTATVTTTQTLPTTATETTTATTTVTATETTTVPVTTTTTTTSTTATTSTTTTTSTRIITTTTITTLVPMALAAAEACEPTTPTSHTVTVSSTGPGSASPGTGTYSGTAPFTATANGGAIFLGWTVDGVYVGFGTPLDLPVTKDRTVVAAFATIPQFCDITTSTPNSTAIANLAARGVILGSDNPNGPGKCFRPDDVLFRIHVAGMVARLYGWDAEDHGNTFTDKGSVDDALWRNAGTLAFYNVALGYRDGTYDPTGAVLHAQTVSFVSRAMIRKEYWALLEDNATYYTAVPQSSGHRQDAVTYYANAGNIPGTSAPTDPWGGPSGYAGPATRSYFAQVLWQGYSSYFSTNRIP